MKKNFIVLAFCAALAAFGLYATQGVFAQQSINTTTLSSALSAPIASAGNGSITATGANNQFALAAVTNVAVGNEIYVDQEAMLVTAVNTTTKQITVQRGYDGTNVASHANGALVFIGAVSGTIGSPFVFSDPAAGSCTATNEVFNVRINVVNGKHWKCASNGWRPANYAIPALSLPVYSGQTAGTTITTLLPSQSGSTFLFDAASGNNYKLPAPIVGMIFDFIQTVTVTSNSAEVQTDGAATFIQGTVQIEGVATTVAFACNGTSHVAVKSNGTTTGGILGGHLHFVAVSSTVWQVDGLLNGSGTGATPCTATP